MKCLTSDIALLPCVSKCGSLFRTIIFRILSGPLVAFLEWSAIQFMVISIREDLKRLQPEFIARTEGHQELAETSAMAFNGSPRGMIREEEEGEEEEGEEEMTEVQAFTAWVGRMTRMTVKPAAETGKVKQRKRVYESSDEDYDHITGTLRDDDSGSDSDSAHSSGSSSGSSRGSGGGEGLTSTAAQSDGNGDGDGDGEDPEPATLWSGMSTDRTATIVGSPNEGIRLGDVDDRGGVVRRRISSKDTR
jgi:hypothetical protein